ncbi:ABC transporter, ATP-binding & transmembrane domain [Galdieria sulphuraria]|uniref:ABC transporter, ATP-binding & transmembrane domain n=1 Tax=Galdieria sulphuraria TaxID=130081 RepID=M2X071_GALSU|nr:ABC transporter, ATP-binding & transmembrane domain [Galdieria sulphuraria]EME29725.1 ABC transporter, ATP-binding & transmembrane domain [Galdieria sulphuraria]|eukprot:XP_005706245.1 ABC transporter, ATP-binding & transmembrane domain [Galdieria sulphuraria]
MINWYREGKYHKEATFSFQFLRNLYTIFILSQVSKKDRYLLGLWSVLIVISLLCSYQIILIPGKIYQYLLEGDKENFVRELWTLLFWCILITCIRISRAACQAVLSNRARKAVTEYIQSIYLSSFSFYLLQNCKDFPDNPDQRIVSDIEQLFELFYQTLGGQLGSSGLIEAVLNILWYSFQTLVRCGLVGIAIAYAWSTLIGAVETLLVNVVSPWIFQQEVFQAWFRFLHIDLRRNAEYILFQGDGNFEKQRLQEALESVVDNRYRIIFRQLGLNSVQVGYGYLTNLIMYITIGIVLLQGSYWSLEKDSAKAEWIAQTSGIFISLLYGFTTLIQRGTNLSSLVPVCTRVAQLLDKLKTLTHTSMESCIELHRDRIEVCDMVVKTLDDRVLLSSLSFQVAKAESLLICGPSGIGKTCIIRCLRGLWTPLRGRIFRPALSEVSYHGIYFLPEYPYLPPNCSLREQLCYPKSKNSQKEEELELSSLLKYVGLSNLQHRTGGLDSQTDLALLLSAGEKQKLCLARALYHKPSWIVMDEAICHLDTESKQAIYEVLKFRGIGFITGKTLKLPKKGLDTDVEE